MTVTILDIDIGLYKREEVSLGRAAEVAGIPTVEFMGELARRHIPINFDGHDLNSDIVTLDKLS